MFVRAIELIFYAPRHSPLNSPEAPSVARSGPAREFREVTTLINIVGGNNNCEQRPLREYYVGEESFVSAEFLGTSLGVSRCLVRYFAALGSVEVNAAGFFRLYGAQNDEYHECEDLWLINTSEKICC